MYSKNSNAKYSMNYVHPSCKKKTLSLLHYSDPPYIIYSLPFHVLAPFQTPLGRGLYRSVSRGGGLLDTTGTDPPLKLSRILFLQLLRGLAPIAPPPFKPPCTLVTTHLRRVRLLDVEDVQVF